MTSPSKLRRRRTALLLFGFWLFIGFLVRRLWPAFLMGVITALIIEFTDPQGFDEKD